MKLINFLVVVIAGLTISACSKAPSEGDAKQVVQNTLGGCRYLSIDSFEKVNGIADGDRGYRVEVKYSVKMTPTAENKKAAEAASVELSKLNREYKEAKPRKDKYYEARSAYTMKNYEKLGGVNVTIGELDSKFDADHPEEYKQYLADAEVVSIGATLINAIPLRTQRILVDSFVNECPKVNMNLLKAFFNPNINTGQYAGDMGEYTKDIIKSFAGTIQMIKTDKG